jgi:mannan endo-1,6-alpha-mannosidase
MSALEYQFPEPEAAPAKYIDVAINAFEDIVARWDETTCDGGLKWQIYPENAYGYNYKNSISNGAVFALGARLARYTGEQKYADWAVKLYDWTVKTGLISGDFAVFDGTDDKTNCAKVADETEWSYNVGIFLHGAATMYDYTKGDEKWKKSTAGLLNHASVFFKPFDNATDIMYERACETGGYQVTGRNCNLDQQSFKAYLARFMAKTAILAPFTKDTVTTLLTTSAVGAAKSCSGGDDGVMCGSKWFTGSWDGTTGVGQQLSALEVTQALLMLKQNIVPGTAGAEKPAEPTPTASSSAAVESEAVPTSTTIPEAVSSAVPSEVASSAVASEVASSTAPSEVISSAAPSSTGAPAAPVSTDAGYVPGTTAVPSATDKPEVPAPSSPGSPISSGKPAEFPETGPNCSKTTLTIYYTPLPTTSVSVPEPSSPVPAPSVPVVEPSAPVPVPTEPVTIPSTVVPPPASNTTVPPAEFTGAASNIKMTGFSVLGAVAVAALAGLL